MLQGKKIVLGITGGIAAYKCTFLVRLLVREGAAVKVIMTPAATAFVTPQSLAVLSKEEVVIDFFDASNNWNNHVALAEWADVLLLAPLTANTLSKMAHGACDNVLLATYLSAKSKTIIVPAMDLDMYQHPTVKHNLDLLKSYGNLVIPAEHGELASGLVGEGRMAEPETIVNYLKHYFKSLAPLLGKKVLINAGPTYEALDPVRFIGNRSSGKMGIAIADYCAALGADVHLVLGPSAHSPAQHSVKLSRVESSDEMYAAMLAHYADQDWVICSAAVADYSPQEVSAQKIKKKAQELQLSLKKTVDILAELGQRKQQQILVGFALETQDIEAYAAKKLKAKNLDVIVANSAVEEGSGFVVDTNKITLLDKHNKITKFELKPKAMVARDIIDYLIRFKP